MTLVGCLVALALAASTPLRTSQDPPDVGPNLPKEPIAQEFSLERGRKFMDDVSLQWQRQRKCRLRLELRVV